MKVIKVAFNCIRIVDRSEITLAPVLILFTLSINWITINPVMLAIKENSCIFMLLVIFASFNAKGRLDWSKQILNLVNVLGLQWWSKSLTTLICAVSFTTVQLFYFTTRPNLQTDSTNFEGASVKFLRIWGSSRESRLAFKTICFVSCNLSGIFSKAYSRHKCYRNLKQTKTTQKKLNPAYTCQFFLPLYERRLKSET